METRRMESIGHRIKGGLKQKLGQLIGDAKLQADGAAERVVGEAWMHAAEPIVAGIDTDRISGVGHQLKGAGKQALGRLLGDAALTLDGTAERSAGKIQNAAGSARDEAREAGKDHAPKQDAPKELP